MDNKKKLENSYNKINISINNEIEKIFKISSDNLTIISNKLLNTITNTFLSNSITLDENKIKVILFDDIINQLNPELSLLINKSKNVLTDKNNSIYSKFVDSLNNNIVNNEETKSFIDNELSSYNIEYDFSIVKNIWDNSIIELFKDLNVNVNIKNIIVNEVNKLCQETINLFNKLNNNYINTIFDKIKSIYNNIIDNKEETFDSLEIIELENIEILE